MKIYKLLYSEFWKQIIVMLTLPLLLFFPVVILLINADGLSDVMLLSVVMGTMALAIFLTVYIFKKHVNMLTSVSISSTGINIVPDKKTLFYRFEHLFIPFSNLTTVTDDEDIQNDYRRFYNLSVKHPKKSIILAVPKNQSPESMQEFSLVLHSAVKGFNSVAKSSGAAIKERSFYSGPFAKILTAVCVAVAIALAIAKMVYPASVPWYRLIAFYCLTFGWLGNYYYATKKEKERSGNV